jgi:hypothetical protein
VYEKLAGVKICLLNFECCPLAHPIFQARLSNQIEIQFPQICVSFGLKLASEGEQA